MAILGMDLVGSSSMTSIEGTVDTDSYSPMGEYGNIFDVELSLKDAHRLRKIGHDIMFSSGSGVDVHDNSIVASLPAPAHFNRADLPDLNVASLYITAHEQTDDEGEWWRMSVRRHSYRKTGTRASLDLIAGYEVEVLGDEIMLAKRGLYMARMSESFVVSSRSIDIQHHSRRVKTETPLLPTHINLLDRHTQSIIKRVESNPL